ncbi:pyridoxal phosphate-dependent aminotransferase [Patescibacteria group bacterium]
MFSERILQMAPSATLALNAKAQELKKQGVDVVNMAVGQPDFPIPENIKQAAIKAVEEGNSKYTPASGTPELKQAIVDKFARENNLQYEVADIVVASGAKPILYAAMLALCDPGDEVLVPSPYWVTYPDDIKLAGLKPVIVEAKEEDGFEIKAEKIAEKITDRTKILILNDPSNPTGGIISEEEKRKIAELCLKHDIWIMADEMYERLVFDGEYFSIASIDKDVWNKTITVNGLSKTYAMPGWRIGYAGMPPEVAKKIGGALSHITGNPNAIAQVASIEALNGPQDEVGKMREIYHKRRDMFVDGLNKINGIKCVKPGGAFYLYPNLSGNYNDEISDSTKMAAKLLEEAHIAAVPGAAFGTDEHVRFSFATSEERIQECLNRLEKLFG